MNPADISLDVLTSVSSLRDAVAVNLYVPDAVGVNSTEPESPFFAYVSLATSLPLSSDMATSTWSHASATLEPTFILNDTVILPFSAVADVSEGVITELHGFLTISSSPPSVTDM